jgi:beta-lactamase class A
LKDVLTLMVIVSDNTATNMAIDRLGLEHIDHTLKAAGLKQTYLYKKVFMPPSGPMPPDQPKFGLGKTTAREMAGIMQRFAECRLDLDSSSPKAQLAAPQVPADGPICGAILHMLRSQQERDSIPRYLETLDTGEQGSAIANKAGALDAVRNDVALIATKTGPVVMAVFTWDNKDQRWTGDNQAQQMIGKLAEAVVKRWSPAGLDAESFPWENPLKGRE